MAILRYFYDINESAKTPYERVVNEGEFLRILDNLKHGSKEAQTLECIQSCVKAKIGLG